MKNNFGLIFVIHTKRGIRSIKLTPAKLITSSAILLIAISFVFFVSASWLSQAIYKNKIQKIKKNNARLVSVIYELSNRMKRMEAELAILAEKDRALRTYVDLPLVDADIRKLGIGGKVTSEIEEIDHLIPEQGAKVSELALNLDQLARQMKFERISYEAIYNAFKYRTNQIQSTPSIRPVNFGFITDGYGLRKDPFTGRLEFHYGIDISAPMGTPVYATADGVIGNTGYQGAYGNVIIVHHGFGYTTIYAHLSKIYVRTGDVVKRGQRIGEVGSTGRSTGPHLHYEVLQFNINKNPLDYFFTGLVR